MTPKAPDLACLTVLDHAVATESEQEEHVELMKVGLVHSPNGLDAGTSRVDVTESTQTGCVEGRVVIRTVSSFQKLVERAGQHFQIRWHAPGERIDQKEPDRVGWRAACRNVLHPSGGFLEVAVGVPAADGLLMLDRPVPRRASCAMLDKLMEERVVGS
ncbi:hypothetical protein OUY22_07685 [Nonomuraea sp. MCN248]|uniref:Uncharacterized protein n=1 Tax=Nonomuraea corallina TaxID=2989783 RepID=A0ABT4S7Y3_9ACTN|nr:hypothetical protein [Nonomuraea corallina]MDA0633299.1 hypothetical protein [Nonomuraea corallina]